MERIDILAKQVCRYILDMSYNSQTSHIGSAFSYVEVLYALYQNILKVFSNEPKNTNRDRFFLSKGHTCAALYPVD